MGEMRDSIVMIFNIMIMKKQTIEGAIQTAVSSFSLSLSLSLSFSLSVCWFSFQLYPFDPYPTHYVSMPRFHYLPVLLPYLDSVRT